MISKNDPNGLYPLGIVVHSDDDRLKLDNILKDRKFRDYVIDINDAGVLDSINKMCGNKQINGIITINGEARIKEICDNVRGEMRKKGITGKVYVKIMDDPDETELRNIMLLTDVVGICIDVPSIDIKNIKKVIKYTKYTKTTKDDCGCGG